MQNLFEPKWVTIVSGLPRSGTSMMMQMIAAGGMAPLTDRIRAADDDNQKGYYEFEPVKRTRQDASWLPTAVGKVVKIIYMLLYDLPSDYEYRVVFMQRKIDEVLASQRTMLERRGEAGANVSPQQMAELFAGQLRKMDEWLAGRPNFRVLKIDYHDVLALPQKQATRINEFLDRGLDEAAMGAAVDPALRRQRA